jgi:hypothetical protein
MVSADPERSNAGEKGVLEADSRSAIRACGTAPVDA